MRWLLYGTTLTFSATFDEDVIRIACILSNYARIHYLHSPSGPEGNTATIGDLATSYFKIWDIGRVVEIFSCTGASQSKSYDILDTLGADLSISGSSKDVGQHLDVEFLHAGLQDTSAKPDVTMI